MLLCLDNVETLLKYDNIGDGGGGGGGGGGG